MKVSRLIAVCIAAVSLGGCSVFMEPLPESTYNWQKTGQPLPMTEHIIPQSAVQAYCSQTSRFVMACAYRDHEHCWVFASSKGLMDMMREHETRHCKGWSHQVI
jgi:hypothetical protein